MTDLRIIITGGTIDKVHNMETEGLSFSSSGETHIDAMLQHGRCYFPVVDLLMLKDSLDFDDADREAIAAAIKAAPEPAIVVTHGTGTMDKTARFLSDTVSGKTVILTGAMRPFSLGASDGLFNLGGAIIAAQCIPIGVWGVMNGRIIPADSLVKDVKRGRFDT